MSRRTFLVTGATGDTGGATVEQILARGHHVRALAHRQDDRAKRLQGLGAEVVFGDFLNLDDVRAALQGVAGAYFCYPIRPGIIQATAIFAQAAKEAGVACVVNMSQISAREDAKSQCRTRSLASRACLRLVEPNGRTPAANVFRRVAVVSRAHDPRRVAPRAVRHRPSCTNCR